MQISCHRFLKYWVSRLLLIPSKSRTKGWEQVNTDGPGGGPVGDAKIRGHWGWSYSPKAPQEQHQEKHGFWNTERIRGGCLGHLCSLRRPCSLGRPCFLRCTHSLGSQVEHCPCPLWDRPVLVSELRDLEWYITHGNRPQLSRKGVSLVKTKEKMAGETFKENSIQKVGKLKFYNIVILIKPRCQEKHYTVEFSIVETHNTCLKKIIIIPKGVTQMFFKVSF